MDDQQALLNLIGSDKYIVFTTLRDYIEKNYTLEQVLKEQNIKTKKWKYELKFIKGSKTICSFYFANHCLGFMIIFGKDERNKIESIKDQLSNELNTFYEETPTYHDGKWLMLELENLSLLEDIKKLLSIKRKPNK